ncbi:MAG: peroxiredoxin [Acidimicrobiales bacterium]|jgi:peroxiredoxin|nr:peroxiredoxin [Acidimicrobiales bacterium]
MAIEIGSDAPDFTLKDQSGDEVTLSSFEGRSPVAVVFYPFTFTGVCEGELCTIRDDFGEFEAAGVQVLAVSCDSRFAQAKWAEEMGYTFPVLSDFWPHGAAAKAFGVFNEALGCANRGTFVIDASGTVVDAFESPDLGTARPAERYREAIAKL